ncbi:MAG: hypothetical protein IJ789_01105 [Bacteroidales bacterium]|nr:hypothetical protein [Bacteroidales bacterium]
MKQKSTLFIVLAIIVSCFGLAGCTGLKVASNSDFAQTSVAPFNQNNFRVVKRVRGESSVTKIFGLGGMGNKYLKNSAITDMYDNANLTGSQTIVDVRVIRSTRAILGPVYTESMVVATGTVIEFTGPAQDPNPKAVKIVQ